MRHRVFVAINLPENIKNKLAEYQEKMPDLPVRWTKKENLHITLMFLGYLIDEELFEVCNITKEIASKNQSFSINLKKIIYGPPKKIPPRLVWVEGEKSEELGKLQKDLENSFLTSPVKGLESESRPYTSHISLGRIKTWEFKQIEPEERPEINEDINSSFEVNSIEVMESQLKRTGPYYTILESCPLKS
ncbi:MAG: RNA 2',3'-cyclic phosphodiesterase [Candidatus Nealsonbacteria bacterium]|nr:RNA 2',3'-cyclic phosphodiesterase [Candidatus Nealsonbacteria bacterium]